MFVDMFVADLIFYFSPEWVSLCVSKSSNEANVASHWSQANSLYLVWVRLCLFRLPDRENTLPHWVQPNGFFPVCFVLCSLSSLVVEKALSQMVQPKVGGGLFWLFWEKAYFSYQTGWFWMWFDISNHNLKKYWQKFNF